MEERKKESEYTDKWKKESIWSNERKKERKEIWEKDRKQKKRNESRKKDGEK